MFKVYNSDESVSFTGYDDDVYKFLIGFCEIKMYDLRYINLQDIGSIWSDRYGTMVIENI